MNSAEAEDKDIKFLTELLSIPLTKITWWSGGQGWRIWYFTLENGRTAMVTSAELLNQKKFQLKLLGVGVLPLDVHPATLWKEMVVPRIIQAAEPQTTN
jgi:hypothetical protein